MSELPAEACGLLAGRQGQIEKIYKIPNISPNSQIEFLMEPQAQLDAMLEIDALGWELLAIYHSHPPGSRTDPSSVDLRDASYPGALSLIMVPSFDRDTMSTRAFLIDNAHATEVPTILVHDLAPSPSSAADD